VVRRDVCALVLPFACFFGHGRSGSSEFSPLWGVLHTSQDLLPVWMEEVREFRLPEFPFGSIDHVNVDLRQ